MSKITGEEMLTTDFVDRIAVESTKIKQAELAELGLERAAYVPIISPADVRIVLSVFRRIAPECQADDCTNPVIPPRRVYCSKKCRWRQEKRRYRDRKKNERRNDHV